MLKKRCYVCNKFKKISEFYKDRSRKDSLENKCKKCSNEKKHLWWMKLSEAEKAKRKYHRKAKEKIYAGNRRKNIKYRLKTAVSRSILRSIRNQKNGLHWEDLVGYSWTDLKSHLEKLFKDGMSWENYGKIDVIGK